MSVSEILNLPNAEQQKEMVQVLQAISNGVSDIAGKKRPFTEIREWRTIQALVRLGLAPQFFKVGDQLQCKHEVYGTLIWDILDFDYDIPVDANGNYLTTVKADGSVRPMHSLTLQLHNCLSVALPIGYTDDYRWNTSYLRQWINSDKLISQYFNQQGFLLGLDEDLKSIITPCAKANIENTYDAFRTCYLTTETIFLPSYSEIYGGLLYGYQDGAIVKTLDEEINANKIYVVRNNNNTFTKVNSLSSGTPQSNNWYELKGAYDFYKNNSSLVQPSKLSDTNRIKLDSQNQIQNYWLRTQGTNYRSDLFYIDQTGAIKTINSGTKRVAPCCVIA